MMRTATAKAHPNIAFIKYWGNRDDDFRLPMNSSISMNLGDLHTITTVEWRDDLTQDTLEINDMIASEVARYRVSIHLEIIRERLEIHDAARVVSHNNFPIGAGIASSASAFAALTVAAVKAAGKTLSERELTTLARRGSGSASRSIPTGFVEWYAGETHENSYAASVAPPHHWDLVDVIAVVNRRHKAVGSQAGHPTAATSDLQSARVRTAQDRLDQCRDALLRKDFAVFADIVEYDSNLMHAIMMTSRPPLFYWEPATLSIMEAVRQWRDDGVRVCYTLDAGPNVHCLCIKEDADVVRSKIESMSDVQTVLVSTPGGPTEILPS